MSRLWERFWFDFRVSSLHLAIFRFAFFSLFALDAWLQIKGAPRYFAGDFNVSQLAGSPLESLLPTPNRPLMLTLFIGQAYLAACLAVGRLSRVWVAVLAVLFGLGYFVSQLDSYQHHFMMLLVLGALSFQRWQPEERARSSLGDWPLRLVLVVVSLVYFWAIVTKAEPIWLEGRTLSAQVSKGWMKALIDGLPIGSNRPLGSWAFASQMVMLIEALLAVAIHVRSLRLPAFVIGTGFHLALELSGQLSIGLFSYFMVALYLLVLPVEDIRRWLSKPFPGLAAPLPASSEGKDRELALGKRLIAFAIVIMTLGGALIGLSLFSSGWAVYVPAVLTAFGILLLLRGSTVARKEGASEASPPPAAPSTSHRYLGAMAILLGAGGTWLALPFEDAPVLAAVVGILGLGLAVHWWLTQTKRLRIVGTHLVACAAIALLAQVTDTAHKYYLSLGYASHRFGERQAAVHGFTRATEVAPDDEVANRYLAGLIMDDDPQRALQLFRKGQQIAPDEFRNYLGEAMLYHRMSRGEEAYRAAKEAESRAPGNKDALAIMSYWRAQLPNMP